MNLSEYRKEIRCISCYDIFMSTKMGFKFCSDCAKKPRVYMAKYGDTVKVGSTKNINKRLYQVSNIYQLQGYPVATVAFDSHGVARMVEWHLHRALHNFRRKGLGGSREFYWATDECMDIALGLFRGGEFYAQSNGVVTDKIIAGWKGVK